jgi:hypothetical protein
MTLAATPRVCGFCLLCAFFRARSRLFQNFANRSERALCTYKAVLGLNANRRALGAATPHPPLEAIYEAGFFDASAKPCDRRRPWLCMPEAFAQPRPALSSVLASPR